MNIPEYQKSIYFVYPELYEGFYRNFLKRNEFKHLLLAGVLLHLTFETVITFYIRYFINLIIDRLKNGPILQYWNNTYEFNNLPDKLDFFYYVILSADGRSESTIKITINFYNQLASLRNKIVHAHEVSMKKYTDGSIEKSPLASKLDGNEMEKIYDDFWIVLENFLNLFVIANSVQPNERKWQEKFIKEIFVIEPVKKLKEIERNLNQFNSY